MVSDRASKPLALPVVTLAMGLLVIWILCFIGDFRSIFREWRDSPYEVHGMLLAALVPLLIWRRRNDLSTSTGGRNQAIAACVLTSAAIAFFHAATIFTAVWLLLPCLAILTVAIAFGWRTASELVGPIGYLVFALPVWQRAALPLQSLTAIASATALRALQVPVVVRGELLAVPGGTFEIGALCSGTHFLVVAVALAVLIGMMDRLPVRRTATLAVVAAAIAIVTNWVRVVVVIYVGNTTRMRSPLVWDHYAFSWWLLAAALFPFMWWAIHSQRHAPAVAQTRPELPRSVPGARLALAVLTLLACAAWIRLIDSRANVEEVSIRLPAAGIWIASDVTDSDWLPNFPGAAVEALRSLHHDGSVVTIFAAAYGRQERGRKLIGVNSTIAGSNWIEENRSTARNPGPAGVTVAELVSKDPRGRRRVVWFWYEVEAERFLSPTVVMLREGLAAFGAGRRSAVVALSAQCSPDCALARATLAAAYEAGLGRTTISGVASRSEHAQSISLPRAGPAARASRLTY